MKFFADTAEIADIKELAATGLLDGVTTNPSLIMKSGRDFMEVTKEICGLTDGPVSAEVVALDHAGDDERGRGSAQDCRQCLHQGAADDRWPQNLQGADQRRHDGQCHALLLGQSGVARGEGGGDLCSPFVGRHDDNGFDGMQLISDIRLIYDNYDFGTEILVASVRHGIHVLEAAKIGADVMTAPPSVIKGLFKHVLTDKGIEGFLADWAKTGQAIG
jgi:transaldolase